MNSSSQVRRQHVRSHRHLRFESLEVRNLLAAPTAHDGPWQIDVDPDSQSGMFTWGRLQDENFVDHMFQQWFWFRFGDTPEQSLDTLTDTGASATDNVIEISRTGAGLDVDVRYELESLNARQSRITEIVSITNVSGNSIDDLHWFEYTDLDLDNTVSDDIGEVISPVQIRQNSPIGGTIVDTQVIGGRLPDRFEMDEYPLLLNRLNDGVATDLSNSPTTLGPEDVTHAFQWDFNPIGPGQSVEYTKIKAIVEDIVVPIDVIDGVFILEDDFPPGCDDLTQVCEPPRTYDPPVSVGYDYEIISGPNFGLVSLPVGFTDSQYSLLPDTDAGTPGVQPGAPIPLTGGVPFNLLMNVDAAGLAAFRILGIEPDAAVDPADPLGFPTGLSFVTSSSVAFTMTPIEDTATTSFSYVDADNDKVFTAGVDVALVNGEIEDGFFDTRLTEGGYTSVIAGAGLVINGAPITATDVTYLATGNLVVNTNLTATRDIRLASFNGSVSLDDPTISAGIDLSIHADGIFSTSDVISAGRNLRLRARFQTDLVLLNTDVIAGRDMYLSGHNVDLTSSRLDAGQDVQVLADQTLDATEARVLAGRNIRRMRAWHGDLVAERAVLEAGQDIFVKSERSNVVLDLATLDAERNLKAISLRGDVSANIALVLAGDEIAIRARQGTITALGSLFVGQTVDFQAEVIQIGCVIGFDPTVIVGDSGINLDATDAIFADTAFLQACDGSVRVQADNDVWMNEMVVRALDEIFIESLLGDVYLNLADVAIGVGSLDGTIEVIGDTIFADGATFTAPGAAVTLDGTVVGTAAIVDGTKPCFGG